MNQEGWQFRRVGSSLGVLNERMRIGPKFFDKNSSSHIQNSTSNSQKIETTGAVFSSSDEILKFNPCTCGPWRKMADTLDWRFFWGTNLPVFPVCMGITLWECMIIVASKHPISLMPIGGRSLGIISARSGKLDVNWIKIYSKILCMATWGTIHVPLLCKEVVYSNLNSYH